MYNICNLNY